MVFLWNSFIIISAYYKMVLPTDSLKKLQVQFLTLAARWANYGTEVEPTSVDLPNIVCLLQSVGYNLRRIDCVAPEEVPLLRDGQKGNRIVITCCHSGQRCFLEMPEDQEQCKCVVKEDKSQDSFWEVTATNSSSKNASLIETGSDAVPTITKDLSTLIKNMLFLLTHMVQGTLEEAEESLCKSTSSLHSNTSKGATSSPKKDAKRLSGFIKDLVNPPIIISSPKGSASPARYRSLDALTKNPDDILTNPGPLTPKSQTKNGVNISQSSPALHLLRNEFTNSSESTLADSNNEKVIQLLNQAILILQTNKSNNVSPSTPLKQTTFTTKKPLVMNKGASAINKNLVNAKKTYKLKRFTSSGTDFERVAKITKSLPPKPTIKQKTIPKSVEPKTIEDRTKKIIPRPKKSVNLYPLVKSTIPKPSPAGSFVSKKV